MDMSAFLEKLFDTYARQYPSISYPSKIPLCKLWSLEKQELAESKQNETITTTSEDIRSHQVEDCCELALPRFPFRDVGEPTLRLADTVHSTTGASKAKYSSWKLKINTVQTANKMQIGRIIATACHRMGCIFCCLWSFTRVSQQTDMFYFSHKWQGLRQELPSKTKSG